MRPPQSRRTKPKTERVGGRRSSPKGQVRPIFTLHTFRQHCPQGSCAIAPDLFSTEGLLSQIIIQILHKCQSPFNIALLQIHKSVCSVFFKEAFLFLTVGGRQVSSHQILSDELAKLSIELIWSGDSCFVSCQWIFWRGAWAHNSRWATCVCPYDGHASRLQCTDCV